MRYFTAFLSLLICTVVTAQTKYEPEILVLSPNLTTCDKSLEKEVSSYDKKLKSSLNASRKSESLEPHGVENIPENLDAMAKSELEFLKGLDFYKKASLMSEQYLSYRFFEKFPNVFIKLLDAKSDGTLANLKGFAEREKLQYVVNFTAIHLYKEKNESRASINVQLYDNRINAILLDKSFVGDWNNPGFEFGCTDKTIECTLNNALSQALNELIYIIASNNPTLIRERQLQQERSVLLANNYRSSGFDKQLLKDIIPSSDSSVNTEMAYQALYNNDKTKFVAFFIQQVPSQDLKSLSDAHKDNNVQIISGKDIKDAGILDEIPQTYGYIVSGVKHNGKWYYKKSNTTYFDEDGTDGGKLEFYNRLQVLNFFKENSTDLNPDFWETKLFNKVPDLTKDPEWKKYGESIWKTEEIMNRNYIGMYEIVADAMREEARLRNVAFEENSKKLFDTLYVSLKSSEPKKYTKISENHLIYPTDKSAVIAPVVITDHNGSRTIHYYVLLCNSNELYEWTYFAPQQVKDTYWGSMVVDQISTLTNWNFSLENLDDKNFWNEWVLAKSGNSYKYLQQPK